MLEQALLRPPKACFRALSQSVPMVRASTDAFIQLEQHGNDPLQCNFLASAAACKCFVFQFLSLRFLLPYMGLSVVVHGGDTNFRDRSAIVE